MRRLGKCLLALILFFAIERFCHSKTAGFALIKTAFDAPYRPEWEIAALPSDEKLLIDDILKQKFTFLGHGKTCFAFLSEDKQYVIKFFNFHHLTPSLPFLLKLPLPHFFTARNERMVTKVPRCFHSILIAYNDLKEETGLLYLHFNKTDHLHPPLTIIDKMGIEHSIDLDKTPFMIQKKGELALEKIHRLMLEGKKEEAKASVLSLLQHMETVRLKGIHNKDISFRRNYAFIGDQPILIDVGPLTYMDEIRKPQKVKKNNQKPRRKMKRWLKMRHPDLYEELRL